MAPENTENTQQAEKKRQNFHLWVGAGFSTSLLFTSALIGQSAKDTASTVAVGAFLTALICLAVAFLWRETDSHAGIGLSIALYLGLLSTCVGLVNAVRHYDEMLGNYFLVIGVLGIVIALFLPTDASRQRKQFRSPNNTHQEAPLQPQTKP